MAQQDKGALNGVKKAMKDTVQDAKEAVMGAGQNMKESVTGRPTLAPSEDFNTSTLTTNTGAPVDDVEHSMTIGPRGPVVLEDVPLVEKLGQLDREKIPERVVHARGMVAKGYFQVTHDVTDICKADFLSSVGKKTPVAARFSTVVHPSGSPESLRDVRGFSVKFYTQEGNWDFVGNNIPVFFIRDGMQFPDLVHCLRPNPKNNIQESWRILDFLSFHPESVNILTWLLDDYGVPANWHTMEGHSVNTYTMMNKDGKETYIKFIWTPKGGAKFLSDEEVTQVGDLNWRQSHATHDLYQTIENKDYPEWELSVQVMDPADAEKYYFDPLDCTKVWPADLIPPRPVGKMVLDTNIDNFFAEAEQIAFCPAVSVPGIGFSDDKLLQTRVFSYTDTQRYRLGVNYQMLPVNQPKCPFHNNHNDGAMNFMHKNEEVNYYPSAVARKDRPAPKESVTVSTQSVNNRRVRSDYTKQQDEFRQPAERYKSFDDARKKRFQTHVLQWMSDPKLTADVRDTWMGYWAKVDPNLAADLEKQLDEKIIKAKKAFAPAGAGESGPTGGLSK
jgi:catalase